MNANQDFPHSGTVRKFWRHGIYSEACIKLEVRC